MKHRMLACAVLLAVLLCGCAAAGQSAPELLEPVRVGSDLATATITNIYNGTVQEGNILPETAKLSFASGGKIGEVCVTLGARVKKGDVLLRLETSVLEQRRDALAEQLANAEKMDDFDTREAQLTAESYRILYGKDSARLKLYQSEQDEKAAQRAEQIASLRKQLAEAEDALNVQSVVVAPFDGLVAGLNVNVGSYVFPEMTVATLADDSTCLLQTEFMTESSLKFCSEIYATIGGVRYEVRYVPMDTSEFITKSLSGAEMYATFEVEGASGDLIGQYALLYLMTAQREQVLAIPSNAVLRDANGYYVYVDDGSGQQIRREITVGLMTVAQTEILSGLEEGERVYVVG